MDGSRILDAVDLCYDALQDPSAFQALTETICTGIGAEAGDLVIEDLRAGRATALGSHGFDPAFRDSYDAAHLGENPWFDNLAGLPRGRFHTDDSEPPEFWQSPYFNEWVRPQGFHHAIGAAIEASAHRNIWIGFTRSRQAGPFSEIAALDRILPHLARAITLHLEQDAALAEHSRFRTLFDAFSIPVAVLDDHGIVTDMNAACAAFVDKSSALSLSRGGRLMAIDGRADARLGAAVHCAARLMNDPATPPPDPVVVGREGSDRAALHVFPVRGGGEGTAGAVAVAIVKFGPGCRMDIRGFAKAFHLTQVEAELAEWIGAGRPIGDFAEGRGISVSTARWHLKNLEAKTGCTRAAELVALIGASRSPLR